jgi:hypothetical protein
MKKLLSLLPILIMVISVRANNGITEEIPSPNVKINLHLNKTISKNSFNTGSKGGYHSVGPGLMIAGAAFIIGGVLTQNDYTVNQDGSTSDKPFFQQGPKMMAIVGGAGTFILGVGFTIGR